jgi:hypothetical protein
MAHSFNSLAGAAQRVIALDIAHVPDQVAHPPRGFTGDAQFALHLRALGRRFSGTR